MAWMEQSPMTKLINSIKPGSNYKNPHAKAIVNYLNSIGGDWWNSMDEATKLASAERMDDSELLKTDSDYIKFFLDSQTADNDFWNNLTESQQQDYLHQYSEAGDPVKFLGITMGHAPREYDTERLLADLQELSNVPDYDIGEAPIMSDIVDPIDELRKQIEGELNPAYATANKRIDDALALLNNEYANLDTEANNARTMYDEQMRDMNDSFGLTTRGMLSNQYLANAQVHDALMSDMRKSRQNALEAGASAGIRLANNVNTLLSAQNKSSQTAMDTSNNLAQMLLQQRQAATGLRNDYTNYMSDINNRRAGVDSRKSGLNLSRNELDFNHRSELESTVNNRHNAQLEDYNNQYQGYMDRESSWNDRFNNSVSASNALANPAREYYRNKGGNR